MLGPVLKGACGGHGRWGLGALAAQLREVLRDPVDIGGLGRVITGNVMIDRRALGEPGNVVIEDDRHLDALRRWAQAGTAHGTQLWMQLNHPGKQSPRGLNRETVSPSAVPFPPQLASFFATRASCVRMRSRTSSSASPAPHAWRSRPSMSARSTPVKRRCE